MLSSWPAVAKRAEKRVDVSPEVLSHPLRNGGHNRSILIAELDPPAAGADVFPPVSLHPGHDRGPIGLHAGRFPLLQRLADASFGPPDDPLCGIAMREWLRPRLKWGGASPDMRPRMASRRVVWRSFTGRLTCWQWLETPRQLVISPEQRV